MGDHLFTRIDARHDLRARAVALADLHAAFDGFALFNRERGPAAAAAEQCLGGNSQHVVRFPDDEACFDPVAVAEALPPGGR